MSRWDEFGRFKPAPKKPPPARGIRMNKSGTTWWGQRWIEALESVLRGDAGRLARGRTYARAGRTHDLVISNGKVTAKVTGSRSAPYEITIALGPLDEAAWAKAIDLMAKKAQFSAELLAGRMPQAIDEVFREAGVSLFPTQRSDLRTSCSCPDWGDPCKHIAAAHYVLGEAFDQDPFLLFEVRGRAKEHVLDALRAARDASSAPKGKQGRTRELAREDEAQAVPTVKLGKLNAADYDRTSDALPALHLLFQEPVTQGSLLRQLGAPAAWNSDASPADVLAPLVQAAAEAARRLALAEPSDVAEEPPPPEDPPRGSPARRKRAGKRGGK